jgi:membrane protease YdiL (CAAX protease family)
VYFPSLAIGWLRARTGGIGAGVAVHASCNVFSEMLGKGFRVY